MANIRVDIEDHLDEVSTEFLINHIKSRLHNRHTPQSEKELILSIFPSYKPVTIRDEYYAEVFEKLKENFSVSQLEQFLTDKVCNRK